jgi:hypothetical protein
MVCLQPAQQTYSVDKTYTYGKKAVVITLPVPLCASHYAQARAKSRNERLVERIGLVAGGAVGLWVLVGLLVYWGSIGESFSIINIFIAALVGVGFLLIVWTVNAFWLAPTFALPESKAVRGAVKLAKFWKAQDIVELEFSNDLAADRVARENAAQVVP